jgi:hypothetical protein
MCKVQKLYLQKTLKIQQFKVIMMITQESYWTQN